MAPPLGPAGQLEEPLQRKGVPAHRSGKTNEQTVAVSGGKVTLTADAETPYVVYKGEAKQIQVNWSEGMHVVDAGFNGGSNTLTDNWTVSGSGKAEVEGDNNAMLRLTGKVDVSQRLTDLKAGQKYALYVGVDNRSTGDASVTVTSGGKVLATNSTGKSIAKNYIKHTATTRTAIRKMAPATSRTCTCSSPRLRTAMPR